jgi:hypothetical protein
MKITVDVSTVIEVFREKELLMAFIELELVCFIERNVR